MAPASLHALADYSQGQLPLGFSVRNIILSPVVASVASVLGYPFPSPPPACCLDHCGVITCPRHSLESTFQVVAAEDVLLLEPEVTGPEDVDAVTLETKEKLFICVRAGLTLGEFWLHS
jgi:hypothetical protein